MGRHVLEWDERSLSDYAELYPDFESKKNKLDRTMYFERTPAKKIYGTNSFAFGMVGNTVDTLVWQ